ncbi:MAG: beta-Ala-His dipeptidase, partial [Bacteroidales bacterium]|nr:beta-Ala-His dipeptidase [Bacteroidales bacterium]
MEVLSNLEPKKVWQYFEQITKVPRPSKKEEKMVEFLMKFAKDNNLEARRDKVGNVVIRKPATKGMENRKTVVLQSHMDMVCEKNRDVKIDFDNEGITPYIDGEWVKAKGTTLGADDGIGCAAEMAILTDDSVEHGPIECLFTIDEETGLTGAFALEAGFFDGEILLNLDSEDEGEMFIGCAGGIDTVADFAYKKEAVPEHHVAYKFIINGLAGGHSGDEINKGLGNSNKIANRFLQKITSKYFARLAHFDGGNKRNAIPREAEFVFTVKADFAEDVRKEFAKFKEDIIK